MNITATMVAVLVILAAGLALACVQSWLSGQYELARHGWLPAVSRRWYCPRAHVCLRAEADGQDPARYAVLAFCAEHTPVPWLLVHKLNPEYLTYWDEDSGAFWAPVTDFAPYAVRRLRPHVERFGPAPVPWLTLYLPLRQPAGYLEEAA